jgi:hypothetical protein
MTSSRTSDARGPEGNFTYFNGKIDERGEMSGGNTDERWWKHYMHWQTCGSSEWSTFLNHHRFPIK